MKRDPFLIRRLPKYHPARIAFTLYGRSVERACAWRFDSFALVQKPPENLLDVDVGDNHPDTAVTREQMRYLASGLAATEEMKQSCVIEVGCYRGVTTRFLAQRTGRTLFAVDPFRGYGGCDQDLTIFRKNTHDLSNVIPIPWTSGEAARSWDNGQASFVFIDAVHDYVNVAHDIAAWETRLSPGGILALHDTDDRRFSGTRYAVFKTLRTSSGFALYAHTDNLTMLRKACEPLPCCPREGLAK